MTLYEIKENCMVGDTGSPWPLHAIFFALKLFCTPIQYRRSAALKFFVSPEVYVSNTCN